MRLSKVTVITAQRNLLAAPGSPAPDVELVDIEGHSVTLAHFWNSRPLILVFLRHFGCIFCREQVAILRNEYTQFRAAGCEIVCVGQGDPKVGKAFSILMQMPFPLLLCGDDLSVYRAYGLDRGSPWQLFGPASIRRGISAIFSGHRQGQIVGDGFQMPGTFVIDSHGIVQLAHRSVNAGDHPGNADLLRTIKQIHGTS